MKIITGKAIDALGNEHKDTYGYVKCTSCGFRTRRSMRFYSGCEVRLGASGKWIRGCQYHRLTPELQRMVDKIVGPKK